MDKEKMKEFNGRLVAIYYENGGGKPIVAYGRLFVGETKALIVHSNERETTLHEYCLIKKIVSLEEKEVLVKND